MILVKLKRPGQEIFDYWTEIFLGEDGVDPLRLNLLQKLLFVLGSPRSLGCQHFVEDDSNGPDICFVRVLIPSQRFWSHVQRGPNIVLAGLRNLLGTDAKPKISDFE